MFEDKLLLSSKLFNVWTLTLARRQYRQKYSPLNTFFPVKQLWELSPWRRNGYDPVCNMQPPEPPNRGVLLYQM